VWAEYVPSVLLIYHDNGIYRSVHIEDSNWHRLCRYNNNARISDYMGIVRMA